MIFRDVKNNFLFPLIFLLSAAIVIDCSFTCVSAYAATTTSTAKDSGQLLYVQVSAGKLRSKPQHWAPGVLDLRYGDSVTLLERQVTNGSQDSEASWLKVKTSNGVTGYLHSSAVTQREVKFVAKASSTAVAQDSGDIVLAGKGFNPQVERELANRKPTLNFQEVNRMEQRKISDSELGAFIARGKISRS